MKIKSFYWFSNYIRYSRIILWFSLFGSFIFSFFIGCCVLYFILFFGTLKFVFPFSFDFTSISFFSFLRFFFGIFGFISFVLVILMYRGFTFGAFVSLFFPFTFIRFCLRFLWNFFSSREQFADQFIVCKGVVFQHYYSFSDLVEYARSFVYFSDTTLRDMARSFLSHNPGCISDWKQYLVDAGSLSSFSQVIHRFGDFFSSWFAVVLQYILVHPYLSFGIFFFSALVFGGLYRFFFGYFGTTVAASAVVSSSGDSAPAVAPVSPSPVSAVEISELRQSLVDLKEDQERSMSSLRNDLESRILLLASSISGVSFFVVEALGFVKFKPGKVAEEFSVRLHAVTDSGTLSRELVEQDLDIDKNDADKIMMQLRVPASYKLQSLRDRLEDLDKKGKSNDNTYVISE